MTRWPAWRRAMLAAAAVVAALLVVLTVAVHDAKARLLAALGPRATVGDITLSYPQVTLRDVRIAADPAPGAWPSSDEFRAGLVRVRVDLGSLWATRHGAPLRLDDVQVEDALLVALRTPDRLRLLPALRESTQPANADRSGLRSEGPIGSAQAAPPPAAPADATTLVIRHARLERVALDFYDATLGAPTPAHVRLDAVTGDLRAIDLPTLAGPVALDLAGVLKGPSHDGRLHLAGTVAPRRGDAALAFQATGVDLVALQPWFDRLGEGHVAAGSADLQLDLHVVDHELTAPGHLALTGLAFDTGADSVKGAERRAILALLQRQGGLSADFTLQGRTDDTRFLLDRSLLATLASKLGQTAGDSMRGVVDAVRGLFDRR